MFRSARHMFSGKLVGIWWEGLCKSSPSIYRHANDMLWQSKLLFVSGLWHKKKEEEAFCLFVSAPSKLRQKQKWKKPAADRAESFQSVRCVTEPNSCATIADHFSRCVPQSHDFRLSNSWRVSVTQPHSADLWLFNTGNQATESAWKTLCLWCWLKEFFISCFFVFFCIIFQEDLRGWKGSAH